MLAKLGIWQLFTVFFIREGKKDPKILLYMYKTVWALGSYFLFRKREREIHLLTTAKLFLADQKKYALIFNKLPRHGSARAEFCPVKWEVKQIRLTLIHTPLPKALWSKAKSCGWTHHGMFNLAWMFWWCRYSFLIYLLINQTSSKRSFLLLLFLYLGTHVFVWHIFPNCSNSQFYSDAISSICQTSGY